MHRASAAPPPPAICAGLNVPASPDGPLQTHPRRSEAHLRCTSPPVEMGKRRLRSDTRRAAWAGAVGGLGARPVCTHKLLFHPLSLPSGPRLTLALAPHPYQKPLSRGPGGGWVHLPCGLLAICWRP